LEIKILADQQISYEEFRKFTEAEIQSVTRHQIVEQLTTGGVWPQLIQRPFGIVAEPTDEPKAIFVSAVDTHPLAPDLGFTLHGEDRLFQTGLAILNRLSAVTVQLNVKHSSANATTFTTADAVQINRL